MIAILAAVGFKVVYVAWTRVSHRKLFLSLANRLILHPARFCSPPRNQNIISSLVIEIPGFCSTYNDIASTLSRKGWTFLKHVVRFRSDIRLFRPLDNQIIPCSYEFQDKAWFPNVVQCFVISLLQWNHHTHLQCLGSPTSEPWKWRCLQM